ncbi:MAG TPA: aminotransferase class V-fold PLP-dependent enzyme [Candidatus Obscuribacterales bacterium]
MVFTLAATHNVARKAGRESARQAARDLAEREAARQIAEREIERDIAERKAAREVERDVAEREVAERDAAAGVAREVERDLPRDAVRPVRASFDATSGASANKCIYLDNAATTPIDPCVLDAMNSIMTGRVVGNPHAAHHAYGASSSHMIQVARKQVATAVGAAPSEIIFTSGATESNNMLLKGLAGHLKAAGKTHIITGAVEHKSILEPLKQLEEQGFEVSVLAVKPCGMLEADMIERALRENTGLVSVQAVNNETGTIQPLSEIAAVLRRRGIMFHTDASQALGKIPFAVTEAGVDFASLSAHKVYGPQGIGALYIKEERFDLLQPWSSGGGQERGLRSGTLPVALCVGFGMACAIIDEDRPRLQSLRNAFLEKIRTLNPIVHGHKDPEWNVPGILNLRFPGIDSETLVMALPQLAFGQGAACNATGVRTSHVIKATTGSEQSAKEAIRLSFGRFTTSEDVAAAAEQIVAAVTEIRQLQEGMA